MPLLKLDRADLAFGHIPLLDKADLQLDPGERVALIGRNGTGKSSLLAALAGTGTLDDGLLWLDRGVRVAYVPQEPPLPPDETVFETVAAGLGPMAGVLTEYHRVTQALSESDEASAETLLERLHALQAQLEAENAWAWEHRIDAVIERFELPPDARVGTLSGGQKKRVALARGLAMSPEVLLLDEPTNHLDAGRIEWLEEWLVEAGLSLIFVTHDRQFLDRVATRIVELDRGKLVSFPGSYAAYQQRKEGLLHEEYLANQRADKRLKAEEIWIRKGVEARRTRAVFRVQRLDQLRLARAARRDRIGQVGMKVDAGTASGQLVVELDRVNKGFEGREVVRDFSCRIQRGDKVGLIGPNGAGKTTLLRLMLGEITADSGRVRQGTRLEIAYFDQFRAQLNPEDTLINVISPGSDTVEIAGSRKHVIGYLEDFLFAPERARSPVKSLSGGERNRLLLARLFARPANVLVLDEPTNDLDIETLELLEQLLQDYSGTLFLVSHDRAFLDNVVTQTIASTGDGRWHEQVGGYAEWQRYQGYLRAEQSPPMTKAVSPSEKPREKPSSGENKKLTWKENRELETLPGEIESLETEQSTLTSRLSDPSLYACAPEEAQRIAARLAQIETDLLNCLERWEALEAKASATI